MNNYLGLKWTFSTFSAVKLFAENQLGNYVEMMHLQHKVLIFFCLFLKYILHDWRLHINTFIYIPYQVHKYKNRYIFFIIDYYIIILCKFCIEIIIFLYFNL